uniref:Methyltransferase type 11 domain-containing protein n=1 Tax=uncultured Armatimonadetes bacterium TaxID=157466 RepID=A0A6J4H2R2_9BACT|nr:hypothetical protein AVDCRST_MAG63-92 [uncultured Armatimonadetes bacterium]
MLLTEQDPKHDLAQNLSEEARYWEDVGRHWSRERPQGLWRRHSDAVNLALLRRWLPPGRTGRLLKTDLFDEASTDGLFPLLERRSREVWGMDVSPQVVRAARARHPRLQGVVADVRRLPFRAGSFDAVVSNSTLDHFERREDLAASLGELGRVLRDGGDLILTLDNLANPVIALRNALPFFLLQRSGLVPYYVGASCALGGLRRLLAGAGFEVVEADAVLHCPRVLAVFLARLVERRGGAPSQRRFLRSLMPWEGLGKLPTRFVTGHFVAVKAVKRPAGRVSTTAKEGEAFCGKSR